MEGFTITGLHPSNEYYIWIAARSNRGEGAPTPPILASTQEYGKILPRSRYAESASCMKTFKGHKEFQNKMSIEKGWLLNIFSELINYHTIFFLQTDRPC